uniref:Disease resistance protein RPS4B/Roq1-like leucine-rich repeats domain-containing protein n=1 Tax=Manihot esculenta TaxID=3983 RepID=A0A2C9U2G0_MANES
MGEMYLSSKAFVGMYSLRLLKIYDSRVGRNCKVYLPCGLDFLSDELSFLPSNFQAENLVELNLACSYVEQLWTGVQNIVSLKEINLNNSKHLATFPDMSQAKNLERANLEYCTSFVKVSSSIRSGIKLSSLKSLNLSGCSNLTMYPEFAENIMYLNLRETAVEQIPKSIGRLSGLVALNRKDCKRLCFLPENLHDLKSLKTIDLSGCSCIASFPNISTNIRYLYLSETALEEVPSTIGCLSSLSSLDLMNCKRLKNLSRGIC